MRRRQAALAAICTASYLLSMPALAGSDDRDDRVRLRAEAEDEETDLRFKVDYKLRTEEDRTRQKLKIRVWDGIPGEMLAVSINGLLFDWILVNESGNGRLKMRAEDMPDALPELQPGDFVTVGPLGDALEDRDDSGRHRKNRLRLRAEFDEDDETDVRADARYEVRTKKGKMRRRFKARVEGAEEGDEFDVLINGDYLGTIEADEWGEGKLDLRQRDEESDEFPMMQEGDTVTIEDMSATLEAD